jgi:hypothetical protein
MKISKISFIMKWNLKSRIKIVNDSYKYWLSATKNLDGQEKTLTY